MQPDGRIGALTRQFGEWPEATWIESDPSFWTEGIPRKAEVVNWTTEETDNFHGFFHELLSDQSRKDVEVLPDVDEMCGILRILITGTQGL